uniref:Alpha-carbonic anhydrase domain-containing protein n=1 Tax=Mesocestoides corti TaxID=53468 RepID=A0A5K3G5U0_MESCO
RQPNTSVKLVPFPGEALLDIGKDRGRFYRYEGSLTTPPCTENVVWTVMAKVLPVHPQQVGMLMFVPNANIAITFLLHVTIFMSIINSTALI